MQKVRSPRPAPHGSRRRVKSRAAFTLVEVMMAFTILIAGICGGLTTLQSGFKAIDSARCSTLAAQIMQSRIEQLRLLNWTDIQAEVAAEVAAGIPTTVPVTSLVPTSATDIAGRFDLTQSIKPARDELTGVNRTGIVDITLKVTWTNIGNIVQTRSFVTRYAQNGLNDYYFSRR